MQMYIDDIIVFSTDYQSHKTHLKELIQRLCKYNITINILKCEFCKDEISYLGFLVNGDRIKPDLNRIKCENFKFIPKSRKDIQKLCGHINWYRPFVPNLSQRISGLNKLLKKEKEMKITPEIIQELEEIYDEILKGTILNHPEPNQIFELRTDASQNGYGGILTQKGKLISICSGKYNEQQKKYPPIESELFGIIKCLDYLRKLFLEILSFYTLITRI